MSTQAEIRAALAQAKRIVVKVGSRSLLGEDPPRSWRFQAIAQQVQTLRSQDHSVVLVSSGAMALGWMRLGLAQRPTTMAALQACAAAGQSLLMRTYEDIFAQYSVSVAQVLLTHSDFANRERYLNARAALEALLSFNALPIINENDTVSVDEIRFGDNDQLAAMVAALVGADLLILLTDVEGLLDEKQQRVSVLDDVETALGWITKNVSGLGSGGMGSKIEAARRASLAGVPVVIADARNDSTLVDVLAGRDVGTLLMPPGSPLPSRKHWIAYTLKPKGVLVLDDGAVHAVKQKQRSLLPAGVCKHQGEFEPGDAVVLQTQQGAEIGRGLCRYSSRDVARLLGAQSHEIEARLGYHGGDELVHRDDLVVFSHV